MHRGEFLFFRTAGKTRRLRVGRSYTVGSGRKADIRIRDGRVAPVHCRLTCRSGGVTLQDHCGESYTGGRRVERAELRSGSAGSLGKLPFAITGATGRTGGVVSRRDLQSAYRLYERAGRGNLLPFLRYWRGLLPMLLLSLALHLTALFFLWPTVIEPGPGETWLVHTSGKDLFPLENRVEPREGGEEGKEAGSEGQDEPELLEELLTRYRPPAPKLAGTGAGADPEGAHPLVRPIHLETSLAPAPLVRPLFMGGGSARGGTALPLGGRIESLGGTSAPFREVTREYLRYDLETILVLDRTMSMSQGLHLTRRTLVRVLDALRRLVPHYRVGLVTFKDPREEKEGAIAVCPPSPEPWRILNRLQLLRAEGGGGSRESTLLPLRAAIGSFSREGNLRRTLILVGDAASHPEEEEELLALVESFGRGGGKLFTVYTPPVLVNARSEREVMAEHRRLAALTGGKSIRLTGNTPQQAALLLDFFLRGISREDSIKVMENLRRFPPTSERVLRRRFREKGVEWLIGRLSRPPIDNPLVERAVELLPREGVARLVERLGRVEQGGLPPVGRQAALYIILNRVSGEPVLKKKELDRALLQPATRSWLCARIR